MALKSTRVTPQRITASAWQRWVHVRSTAAVSTGAKSARRATSSLAEQRVCLHLNQLGWTEILYDVSCQHVQVDILARSPHGLLTIVEVKMQGHLQLAHLSPKQRRRLARVACFLSQFEPIEILIAFVEPARIELLPLD